MIPQAGVVRCGLLDQVGLEELALLDYLSGWFASRNTAKAIVEGAEYTWLDYAHAASELPLLFHPRTAKPTRKNKLSRLMHRLREAKLIETVRVPRRGAPALYFRLTERAASLGSSRGELVTKSAPLVTGTHDGLVTESRDETITEIHDEKVPLHIDEQCTNEPCNKEPTNMPPSGGSVSGGDQVSLSLEEQAERIYSEYPQKIAKRASLRAIKKALSKISFDDLLAKTKAFAAARNGDLDYCPYSRTWFNEERFNDDPATWKGSSTNRSPSHRQPQPPRKFDSANYQQPVKDF